MRITDPVKAFKTTPEKAKNLCFFYSHSNNGWKNIIAYDAVDKFIYFNDREPFSERKLMNFIKKHNQRKNLILGYFSYDFGVSLYNIRQKAKNDLNLPDICLYAFKNWQEFKNHSKLNPGKKNPSSQSQDASFKVKISKKEYQQNFKKIIRNIKKGEFYQINYTHRLEADCYLPARQIFLEVLKNNPVDFAAYIEGDGFEILSASPERFIKKTGNMITTSPIKGTRPRGKTVSQDLKMKNQLLKSKKEQAELNMITDLLRNDLGQIAIPGTVKVQKHREIQRLPSVWHTYSTINAEIKSHPFPILPMLPGGSISGCPKKRALEFIDEIEPYKRGVYTGIIGQIEPNQNQDFSIAIRTILKKGQKLYLQVGGGIVYDSKMKQEFTETLNKAKSFLNIKC